MVRGCSEFSHSWDLSPAQARALQTRLATHVIQQDALDSVKTVAGVDVGFTPPADALAGRLA